MTINEYFKKEQPISDATLNGTRLYRDVEIINISTSGECFAAVKIAHVGENLWSLGYEIKKWPTAAVICKDCTTNILTKGYIENLVYGMICVILQHIGNTTCILDLKHALIEAAKEAAEYRKLDAPSVGKITI